MSEIHTSKKILYLDKFSVITTDWQVLILMVCIATWQILAKADKSSNTPMTKFVPGKNWTKSTKQTKKCFSCQSYVDVTKICPIDNSFVMDNSNFVC